MNICDIVRNTFYKVTGGNIWEITRYLRAWPVGGELACLEYHTPWPLLAFFAVLSHADYFHAPSEER